MKEEQEEGLVRLPLEGEMTIYTANETKQRLLDALAGGNGLEADLSLVSEFDSVGLQLLLLARAECFRAGKPIRFVGASPVVDEVVRLCGLGALFEQPQPQFAP